MKIENSLPISDLQPNQVAVVAQSSNLVISLLVLIRHLLLHKVLDLLLTLINRILLDDAPLLRRTLADPAALDTYTPLASW